MRELAGGEALIPRRGTIARGEARRTSSDPHTRPATFNLWRRGHDPADPLAVAGALLASLRCVLVNG